MLNWFARRLKEAQEKDKTGQGGFTLIELLVVVIIIGILAAVAIPAFLAQRERAQRAAVESDVRNAATINTALVTDGTAAGIANNTYTAGQSIGNDDNRFSVSEGVQLAVTGTNGENKVITGTSTNTGITGNYVYNASTGQFTPSGDYQ